MKRNFVFLNFSFYLISLPLWNNAGLVDPARTFLFSIIKSKHSPSFIETFRQPNRALTFVHVLTHPNSATNASWCYWPSLITSPPSLLFTPRKLLYYTRDEGDSGGILLLPFNDPHSRRRCYSASLKIMTSLLLAVGNLA